MSISVVIMVALIGLMIWANGKYKTKGAMWGKPVAALSGIIVIIMAFSNILSGGGSQIDTDKYLDKEARYQHTAYKFLGQEIAKQMPGAKILMIKEKDHLDAEGKPNVVTKAKMDGFKEGLGSDVEIKYTKEISVPEPENPEDGGFQDLYQIFTAKMFDDILTSYDGYDAIFMMIDLPYDYKESTYWDPSTWEDLEQKQPKLLLSQASYINDILPGFSGKDPIIKVAMIGSGKKYQWREPYPSDDKVAFDSRWILLTPDNVQNVVSENPKRFGAK
ncbi:MAG: hypothetical protein MK193_09535 [Lentisphaeria bacterium]|nr:hypothetical protein [Lentisphaeria bacterium]